MNKLFSCYCLPLLVAGIVVSCGSDRRETTAATVSFKKIELLDGFTVKVNAGDPEMLGVDALLMNGFRIIDSLFICSNRAIEDVPLIEIYTYPGFKKIASMLNYGRGKGEEIESPFLNDMSLYKDGADGHLKLVYRSGMRKMNVLDITASMAEGRSMVSAAMDPMPETVMFTGHYRDSTFLIRNFEKWSNYKRLFIKDGHIDHAVESSPIEELNAKSVVYETDYTYVMSYMEYNPGLDRFAEFPALLNVINFYSVDGSFTRSVCVDDMPLELETAEKNMKHFYYTESWSDEEICAASFLDVPLTMYESTENSIIRVFDWDGNPLKEIKIDAPVYAFHFDRERNKLIALDFFNNRLLSYDVSL